MTQDIINMPQYLKEVDVQTQPQPFVLSLSTTSHLESRHAYVIVEKWAIQQPSVLKAVDVCFKAHFILDCEYQQQCKGTWTFFEKCIYAQKGATTRESASLRGLRAYLAHKKVQ